MNILIISTEQGMNITVMGYLGDDENEYRDVIGSPLNHMSLQNARSRIQDPWHSGLLAHLVFIDQCSQ